MQQAATLPAPSLPAARNRALMRFMRHRLAVFGLIVIALLILASTVGPSLIPFDDLRIDIRNRFAPPFAGAHILGTDQLGRDLAARLLMAGRISLSVGFAAMLISVVFGTVVGAWPAITAGGSGPC